MGLIVPEVWTQDSSNSNNSQSVLHVNRFMFQMLSKHHNLIHFIVWIYKFIFG